MSAERNNLEILFEDDFILAINKPPGLPSQPTVDKKRADLFTLVKKQMKSENIFLHHRLDRDTSGVILLSKNKKANGPMTDMFREHKFEKIYWALCQPQEKLKDKWEVQNHLVARRNDGRAVKMFRTESGGDFAHTIFRKLASSPEACWIEAQPLTGRTHQIRVHMLHSEASILGDSQYGGKDTRVPRLMLHAKRLSFAHPVLKTEMQIEAPSPADFETLLKKWNLTP
ncbi:MAG: RluA family pseudouridine synthase [Pseudobdellovibrionaceae bacterium]